MLRKLILLLVIGLMILITGCCNKIGENKEINVDKNLYTVVDSTGYKLVFQEKPHRIVSLNTSIDEIIMNLVTAERVVAVTYYADDPGISNCVEKVKNVPFRFRGNSVESLLAMEPDLLIAADWMDKTKIKTFRDMGLKVYVYKTPVSIKEVKESIKNIGKVVGESEKSKKIIDEMDNKINEIKNKLKNIKKDEIKRALQVRSTGVYYRPKSSINDILKFAKVKMAADELNYAKPHNLSKEVVVKLNPNIFYTVDWNYDGKHNTNKEIADLFSDPAYQDLKAIKNKAVYPLLGAHILTLSQYIVYGIEDVAKSAYPEKFVKKS